MSMRLFTSLLLGLVVLLSVACTKRHQQSTHNPEIGVQLAGCWELIQTLESQIATDEANPQLVTGTVQFATDTVLCFNEDQSFSLDAVQKFISYIPAEGVEPLPQDIVEERFSQTIRVTGSYSATSQVIEYDQAEVSSNGELPVTFEEFAAAGGGQLGERVQRVAWSLYDDKLTVLMGQGHKTLEVVYSRKR